MSLCTDCDDELQRIYVKRMIQFAEAFDLGLEDDAWNRQLECQRKFALDNGIRRKRVGILAHIAKKKRDADDDEDDEDDDDDMGGPRQRKRQGQGKETWTCHGTVDCRRIFVHDETCNTYDKPRRNHDPHHRTHQV